MTLLISQHLLCFISLIHNLRAYSSLGILSRLKVYFDFNFSVINLNYCRLVIVYENIIENLILHDNVQLYFIIIVTLRLDYVLDIPHSLNVFFEF